MYGGAAGGGKSDALLMGALEWVDYPGYAALLLRRTFSDLALPNALMARAEAWLTGTDARWDGKNKTWNFPSGATLTFGFLEHTKDMYRYQGAEFQFCLEQSELVFMADRNWRQVGEIRVGDMVHTLDGPRRVTRVGAPRQAECVKATVKDHQGRTIGSQVQSLNHQIMTQQGWTSYADIAGASRLCGSSSPNGFRCVRTDVSPSSWQSRGGVRSPDSRLRGQGQADGLNPRWRDRQSALDTCACAGRPVPETDSLRSEHGSAGMPRPASDSRTPGLPVPGVRSIDLSAAEHSIWHEACGDHPSASRSDFQKNCSKDQGLCGEHALRVAEVCPEGLRQRVDAERQTPMRSEGDDQARTRRYSRHRQQYVHPYTRDRHQTNEPLLEASVEFLPVGARWVVDVTVAGASHYISKTGLVNQNCGFDELTQFEEAQYRYLFSRLRRILGAPFVPKMRAASNPGGVGHEWVRQRFIVEGASKGRVFVPARVQDNPYLDQEGYILSLNELDPVTRAQLLLGDWDARHGGSIFARDWFTAVDEAPDGLKYVWFWDLAATEPKPGKTEPDWTVGTLMGRDPLGTYYVLHVERFQGTPETVEAIMRACAERTGKTVPVYIEQEPGSGGIFTCDHLIKRVLNGFAAYANKDGNSKAVRAAPFSAQCQRGNVKVLRRPWLTKWYDELEAFPLGGNDDQVDSVSGAFKCLQCSQWWQDPLSFQWLIRRLQANDNPVVDGVAISDLLQPGVPAGWDGTAVELQEARLRLAGVMAPITIGASIEKQSKQHAMPAGRQVFFTSSGRPKS